MAVRVSLAHRWFCAGRQILGRGLLLLLFAVPCPMLAEATEEPDDRWRGTMRVVQVGPMDSTAEGEVSTVWEVDVVWAEKRRIPVRDGEGRDVGLFVLLEEEASTWSAVREGVVTKRGECDVYQTTYAAEGQGEGGLHFGWVYLSSHDDDPLAEVLPSGTYFATADAGKFIVGTADVWSQDCRGKVFTHHREDRGMPLSFMLGRQLAHPWDSGQEFIDAEAHRASLEATRELSGMGIRILDSEERIARAVGDDAYVMAGSYVSVGGLGADPGLYWTVSWVIARGIDVYTTYR